MFPNLAYLATLLFTLTAIYAAPVFTRTETGPILTYALSRFYETVVDQVMLEVSETILDSIPTSISRDNEEARFPVMKSMDRQLSFMRASILASIHPLVSLDIHQSVELQSSDLLKDTGRWSQPSIKALFHLNKKMSHQLGLIVNANQSSALLIRQAVSLIHRARISQPTTLTLEWKMPQSFQVTLLPEYPDTSFESTWVLNQLLEVEVTLLKECNDRIQQVTHFVLESLTI